MKDTNYVYAAAAAVILLGVYTHTDFIQSFVRKIKNAGFGGRGGGYGYSNDYGCGYDRWVAGYQYYDSADQSSLTPLTKEQADWFKHNTPLPPLPGETPEEQIKRTEKAKHHKSKSKSKTSEKGHRNTIPRFSGVLPSIEIPALNPQYNQPSYQTPDTGTDVGDNPFDSLSPDDQQQILPSGPSTSPTPIAPPQHVIVPPSSGPPIAGATPAGIYFTPNSGTYKKHKSPCLTYDQQINNYGCYHGCVSEGVRDTCRTQADLSSLYGGDYMIDATVNVGGPSQMPGGGGNNPYTEITSGGPGSYKGACCGFTLGVRNNDGYMHMESEDWTHGQTTGEHYCDDKTGKPVPCTQSRKSVSGPGGLYGKTVRLQWIKQGGRYGGIITGPNGSTGLAWAPGNPRIGVLSGGQKRSPDSSRVRSDAAGMSVTFGPPRVYRL